METKKIGIVKLGFKEALKRFKIVSLPLSFFAVLTIGILALGFYVPITLVLTIPFIVIPSFFAVAAINTISSELESHNVKKRKLFYVRGDSDKGINSTDTASAFSEFAYRKLGFDDYSSSCSYNQTNPSLEALAEYNPDVIVCGGVYARKHHDEILENETMNELNAVKNNDVYVIPVALTQMEQLNALTPEFFYQQANMLYPDIFNFDVNKMIKESCKEYFGTDLTDSQIENILNCKSPSGGELC